MVDKIGSFKAFSGKDLDSIPKPKELKYSYDKTHFTIHVTNGNEYNIARNRCYGNFKKLDWVRQVITKTWMRGNKYEFVKAFAEAVNSWEGDNHAS